MKETVKDLNTLLFHQKRQAHGKSARAMDAQHHWFSRTYRLKQQWIPLYAIRTAQIEKPDTLAFAGPTAWGTSPPSSYFPLSHSGFR